MRKIQGNIHENSNTIDTNIREQDAMRVCVFECFVCFLVVFFDCLAAIGLALGVVL